MTLRNKKRHALDDSIMAVFKSDNHKWYLNEMDPEEAAERKKRKEEFQSLYSK